MPMHPVIFRNGVYAVQLDQADPHPITSAGHPVAQLVQGWYPSGLFGRIGSMSFLYLRTAKGEQTTWYLNGEMAVIAHRFDALPRVARELISQVARIQTRAIWEGIVCGQEIAADLFDYATLDPLTRELFIEHCFNELPAYTRHVGCDDVVGIRQAGGVLIAQEQLRAILTTNVLGHAIAALDGVGVVAPSLVDGTLLQCDASIYLRAATIAYRFSDKHYGLVFYVIATMWNAEVLAIYIPSMGIAVHLDTDRLRHLQQWLDGEAVGKTVLIGVARHASSLASHIPVEQKRIALVCEHRHIGHHLWNELSGLDTAVHRSNLSRLGTVFMMHANDSEMYGKLDDLFPQLKGKVDRTIDAAYELNEAIYSHNLVAVRTTSNCVSRSVANRIVATSSDDACIDGWRALYDELRTAGFRFFLLGLRVENRTVVDLPQFFADIATFLHSEFGDVAIIFDGHNRVANGPSGQSYAVHLGERATVSPMQVELEIVAHARATLKNLPNVRIISTIGAPVAASIYWADRAEFFITPWGAGLAKYRWVCNRPGLVVLSETFVQHSGPDVVHLYDSPNYMEAPAPIYFMPTDAVTEIPDAPQVVEDRMLPRQNYRVDREKLYDCLRQALNDCRKDAA